MNEQTKAVPNGLSTASLIFGILALLTSITVVLVPFNASMAIMFAWLSRGNKKMCSRAAAGNLMGIISLVLGLVVLIAMTVAFVNWLRANSSSQMVQDAQVMLMQILEILSSMSFAR